MLNQSRLIPMQAKFVSMQADQRYHPVRGHHASLSGIVMLVDTDPLKPELVAKCK